MRGSTVAPVQDEARSISLVYQGRLSGHEALRAQLERLGVRFRGDDPGETILRAYQTWGESVAEHLEGTCVFILWDAREQRLLAVRDRLGIRRLYVAEQDGGLILATEAQTLLGLRNRVREPDVRALAYVLTLGYVPAAHSIWKGMTRLEAGETLIWDKRQGVRRRRYWEPPRTTGPDRAADWREVFEAALERTVAPGEPVGLMLSAGLDSSSIALGLSRLGRRVTAIALPGRGSDESPLAEELAQHLHIPCIRAGSIAQKGLGTLLEEIIPTSDEPQSHPSILTTHLMCRTAAQHTELLLTGDGAEEVMGGYPWYEQQPRAKSGARRWLARRLQALKGKGPGGVGSAQPGRGASAVHRHVWDLRPSVLPPQEAADLLAPSNVRFSETDLLAPLLRIDEPALPERRRLQRLDLMTFCADALMPKVHQTSTAQGLDIRLPFLDHPLVEWAIAQPVDPLESKERKPILREYLRGNVPEGVVTLPKHGLRLPWAHLLPVEETLAEVRNGYWARNGYWVPDVEKYVRPGEGHWRGRLWTLHVLERWAAYWLG
jgi:asparagine synthase (glutamine-hydrolysing)